jgi:hypothetical protein
VKTALPLTTAIYGLFTVKLDGSKSYFYVGRSTDVSRRMQEHGYAKRKGHEDKYERIRELEAAGGHPMALRGHRRRGAWAVFP